MNIAKSVELLYSEFEKESSYVVSQMAKEFERKKDSIAFKRSSKKKTGLIDTKMLASYKFREDIFKKISIKPNEKSHSVYVLLDWSGSMQSIVLSMAKQAITLAKFCRRCNIRFKIVAFLTAPKDQNPYGLMEAESSVENNFELVEFISSDLNLSDFRLACSSLFNIARNYGRFQKPDGTYSNLIYSMNSTPLASSLVNVRELIKEDVRINNIQNPNLMVITDGCSDNPMFKTTNNDVLFPSEKYSLYDPRTNIKYNISDYMKDNSRDWYEVSRWRTSTACCSMMLDIIRKDGVGVTGMFLGSSPRKAIHDMIYCDNTTGALDEIRANGGEIKHLNNFISCDKFLFVDPTEIFSGSEMFDEDGELIIEIDTESKTTNGIARDFKKSLSSINSRKSLAKIIVDEIVKNI